MPTAEAKASSHQRGEMDETMFFIECIRQGPIPQSASDENIRRFKGGADYGSCAPVGQALRVRSSNWPRIGLRYAAR